MRSGSQSRSGSPLRPEEPVHGGQGGFVDQHARKARHGEAAGKQRALAQEDIEHVEAEAAEGLQVRQALGEHHVGIAHGLEGGLIDQVGVHILFLEKKVLKFFCLMCYF